MRCVKNNTAFGKWLLGFSRTLLLLLLRVCVLIALPMNAAATATFVIADGNPDVAMSESIWSKNSAATPVGWDNTSESPPGDFENPIYLYESNYVWVQVLQLGTVDGDQDAYLHLFVGRAESDILSSEINQPSNQFIPTTRWTPAQWEAEFDQGNVARIPWFDGLAAHPTLHLSDVANQPGAGNTKWYLFKWKLPLVPPDSDTSNWTYSLFAYVDDNKDTGADFRVSGDDSFAELQLVVRRLAPTSIKQRNIDLE